MDSALATERAGNAVGPKFDRDPIASHVETIIAHLGEDVKRDGLRETPRRARTRRKLRK